MLGLAACSLSLVVTGRPALSLWCEGCSLQWLLLLWSMGSRYAGSRAAAFGLDSIPLQFLGKSLMSLLHREYTRPRILFSCHRPENPTPRHFSPFSMWQLVPWEWIAVQLRMTIRVFRVGGRHAHIWTGASWSSIGNRPERKNSVTRSSSLGSQAYGGDSGALKWHQGSDSWEQVRGIDWLNDWRREKKST